MRQREPLPENRALTAWHEAGHAVISQVLGVRVHWTSIKPDLNSGSHGQTAHDGVLDLLDQWEGWRAGSTMKASPYIAQAVIAMAGYAAQPLRPRHKGQHSTRRRQGYRGSGDMMNAYLHLTHHWYLHARLLQMTKALVCRHKNAIARVAEALLRLDELDGQQVEAVVPLGRWPANRLRPTVTMQREQKRELITLLRARSAGRIDTGRVDPRS